MGKSEELRQLNRRLHAPRLAEAIAGTTAGWVPHYHAALTGLVMASPSVLGRHPVASELSTTSAAGTYAGGAFEFDGSGMRFNVSWRAVGHVSHAGLTMHVALFDRTNNTYVAGSTLALTGTAPALAAATLSVAVSSGIRRASTIYEPRIVVLGGAGSTSIGTLGSAHLISWG